MFADVAGKWFIEVNKISEKCNHPMMIWDIMPHAGASQIHPHVQGFLGKGKYLGKMGKLNNALLLYKKTTGREYFEDYINLHISLGLGTRFGTTSIIVPLDSQKDHEFVIIGKTNINDWIKALYLVYRTYVEELKVYCFSSGMAWPTFIISKHLQKLNSTRQKMSSTSANFGNLMYARIGGRGNCQSVESDVSSLELYVINHLSSDPFITFQALNTTMIKYGNSILPE
jgi:hypothetical protein